MNQGTESTQMQPPKRIRREDPVKINGQSLYMKKEALKPVKREINDRVFKNPNVSQYTVLEIELSESMYVINPIRRPMKIRVAPSTIHSIVRTCRLSVARSPNPFTTGWVAARWAIPQSVVRPAPRYKSRCSMIPPTIWII
jgi:hypothetical protein